MIAWHGLPLAPHAWINLVKLSPSMRGDKRVAIRFNLVARKASDEVTTEDYTKKFGASDNLKYALSSQTVSTDQQPLGKPAPPPSASAAASGGPALASAQH